MVVRGVSLPKLSPGIFGFYCTTEWVSSDSRRFGTYCSKILGAATPVEATGNAGVVECMFLSIRTLFQRLPFRQWRVLP